MPAGRRCSRRPTSSCSTPSSSGASVQLNVTVLNLFNQRLPRRSSSRTCGPTTVYVRSGGVLRWRHQLPVADSGGIGWGGAGRPDVPGSTVPAGQRLSDANHRAVWSEVHLLEPRSSLTDAPADRSNRRGVFDRGVLVIAVLTIVGSLAAAWSNRRTLRIDASRSSTTPPAGRPIESFEEPAKNSSRRSFVSRFALAYYSLGRAEMGLRDFAKAIDAYTKCRATTIAKAASSTVSCRSNRASQDRDGAEGRPDRQPSKPNPSRRVSTSVSCRR